MSSSTMSDEMSQNRVHRQSTSSVTSDDEEEFLDDDEEQSAKGRSTKGQNKDKSQVKNKKTLGRVKIEMAYITNKIRRYTTFSKRKTGIMKKAYELATLTGTEVMLLVASETGHVYTYATAKLQPMITSEAGKALIQTCLAKDEPSVETIVEPSTPLPSTSTVASTTLNNNDVIFVEENQRKKRAHPSIDLSSIDASPSTRPIKCAKLKSSDEISSLNKMNPIENSPTNRFHPHFVATTTPIVPISPSLSSTSSSLTTTNPSIPFPTTTTVALPLSCLIKSDSQQAQQQSNSSALSPTFTLDFNTIKTNGMNIIFAPTSSNSSQSSPPSNTPLVLTFGNLPYPPS